ncbi:MAG TPA: tetratricopeptide repeat protein [Thermoanaerobaculia bacterium]|nr:tetratricopeptide repeat protein [Thermoanaerobaculia bacterium]
MKIHPNEFTLDEFLLSLSRQHLEVVEHLAGCATCRRRFQGLIRQRSLSKRTGDVLPWPSAPGKYGPALAESGQVLLDRERAMAKERAEAPGFFVELMRYPAEQRDLLLQNSPRFHTWGLFELLIERSLETGINHPARGEELGLLALRLSQHLDGGYYGEAIIEDLRARAWAYIGNSHRLRSDLQGAEGAFSAAYGHLHRGTQDPLERAILLDLEASLRRDQRRFEQAFKLLRRAVALFLQSDQRHRAGRSLVKMSTVHHYAGDPEAAIPLLVQAIELIDPEQEPRLLLCARHNLIDDLAEAGRFLEAQRLYRETRPLYRSFPDAWSQNRRHWVKGKIAHGLNQVEQAESLFLAARDGFIGEGIPYDTALVSLELAILYAEQGRMADLKRLAAEMVPIFSSLHIHREALTALAYLKQAVETEKVNLALVNGVAAYLRRAQYDPALRFQEPEG